MYLIYKYSITDRFFISYFLFINDFPHERWRVCLVFGKSPYGWTACNAPFGEVSAMPVPLVLQRHVSREAHLPNPSVLLQKKEQVRAILGSLEQPGLVNRNVKAQGKPNTFLIFWNHLSQVLIQSLQAHTVKQTRDQLRSDWRADFVQEVCQLIAKHIADLMMPDIIISNPPDLEEESIDDFDFWVLGLFWFWVWLPAFVH